LERLFAIRFRADGDIGGASPQRRCVEPGLRERTIRSIRIPECMPRVLSPERDSRQWSRRHSLLGLRLHCTTPTLLAVLPIGCAENHGAEGDDAVSVNDDRPALILARLCSYVSDEELCTVPEQGTAFIQLIATHREVSADPVFETTRDFLDFAEGRGEVYASLEEILADGNPLLAWTPIMIPDARRSEVASAFTP
jgi:hypothetical protein